jgi:hypothetical protein
MRLCGKKSGLMGFVFLSIMMGCCRSFECPLDRIDIDVLLERMTNATTFAQEPLGPSFLVSSYDRTGGNQDWVVYTQAEPSGRITIFEADGPGYISRLWIASYYAERWLFFFDGEKEPRIDLTQDELFGGKFPFLPPLVGESSGGRYSLLPIPFSRSIRIEIVPDKARMTPQNRNYYHVNYTRVGLASSAVSSFPRELSDRQSNLVNAVNENWAQLDSRQAGEITELLAQPVRATLAPSESQVFWQDEGEGLLKRFCIRIDEPDQAGVMTHELLRRLRLQMFWHGAVEPSVDVPLGDFFCNPFYLRTFSSMPVGQEGAAFICRFPMPYYDGARCLLRNDSDVPVTVSFGADGNRDSREGLNAFFHAAWRAKTGNGTLFRMIDVEASGHYVGCFLAAVGQDGSWNILEGDEIIMPDSGEQPPQYGTGLEDYFSGAYYYTTLMDLPLHGLIEKGAMRTDQYRFLLLDDVLFNTSFDATMEFGHGNSAKGYMSCVIYWYADQAVSQRIPQGQRPLLARPADRFELHGLMASLFMLEREGLYADAAARMTYYAQRFATQPWVDLLRVRAAGYREITEGIEAVREDYEAMAKSDYPAAAQAAKDRLWLAENPSNALLGIHAIGRYVLRVDGKEVARGEGKNELQVFRLTISEGEHEWDVELAPTQQGSFFSLCLQTREGQSSMSGTWDEVRVDPLPSVPRPERVAADAVLPNMTVWAFNLNGYVDMQSPANGIQLWAFWDGKPLFAKAHLRRKWRMGEFDAGGVKLRERSREELRAHAID